MTPAPLADLIASALDAHRAAVVDAARGDDVSALLSALDCLASLVVAVQRIAETLEPGDEPNNGGE